MSTGGNPSTTITDTRYKYTTTHTGYTLSNEFVNNRNFSICLTFNLNAGDNGYVVSEQLPIITLPLFKRSDVADYSELINTYQVTHRRAWNAGMDNSTSYTYADFFLNPLWHYTSQDVDVSDQYFTYTHLYTNINENVSIQSVDISEYTSYLPIYTNKYVNNGTYTTDDIFPTVNLILTCDENSIKLYINNKLYSSTDISMYNRDEYGFLYADLLISRNSAFNDYPTQESILNKAWLKTYNLHVFSKCLDSSEIDTVFRKCIKTVTPDYWTNGKIAEPVKFQEIRSPRLQYTMGSEFDPESALFTLTYTYENSGMPLTQRVENVTNKIIWTLDDEDIFTTGGTTKIWANYKNSNVEFTKDYEITVSGQKQFILTKLDENNELTDTISSYDITELTTVQQVLSSDSNGLYDVQIVDTFNNNEIPEKMFQNCKAVYSLSICEGFKTICGYAFDGCTNLNSIHLPESLLDIYLYVFRSTPLLPSEDIVYIDGWLIQYKNATGEITLDENTVAIARAVFSANKNITSVTMPNKVKSIGYRAFYNCTKLANINIPDKIRYIGQQAFYNCIFTEVTLNTTEESVVYFDALNTKLVTLNIGENATNINSNFLNTTTIKTVTVNENNSTYFAENNILYNKEKTELIRVPKSTTLTTLKLPETLTKISSHAIDSCSNVTSISGLDNVTDIGEYAFYNCKGVTTVPEKSIHIGEYAFYGCTNLITFNPNENLKTVESNTFYGCTKLSGDINLSNITTLGINSFYNCSSIDSIILGDNIDSLADNVFYGCSNMTTINIENVTSFGTAVFRGCTKLDNIKLSNNVEELNTYLFYGCRGLKTIRIPDTIVSIPDYCFAECTALSSIELPNKLKSIGSNSLQNCTSLTNIDIPETIKTIGNYALSKCSELVSVVIPGNIETLGDYAFSECIKLTDIKLPTEIISIPLGLFAGCTGIVEITIPNSVVTINASVFRGCTNLETINCSFENLTEIKSYCFDNCQSLNFLDLSNSSITTGIGTYTFSNCTKLTSIKLPNKLTSISDYMFQKCSNIEQIELPDSIKSIGNYSFNGCTKLSSIQISEGVNKINGNAFQDCTNLSSVTLPGTNITSIGSYAFSGCENLETIQLPDSITSLGAYVFDGCVNLSTVIMPNKLTTLGGYTFRNCTKLNSITVPSGVTVINTYLFYGCENLQTISILGSVTRIYTYAFYHCYALTEVTIPSTITTINDYAFHSCTSLKTISIPAKCTTIGTQVFYNCTSLENINVLEGNTKYSSVDGVLFNYAKTQLICYPIGNSRTEYDIPDTTTSTVNYSFSHTTNLTTINIPSSVTTIPQYTFRYSESIKTINVNKTSGSIKNSPWGATSATVNWLQS